MIVFDLQCAHGHVFEVWFGSSRDYDDQKARGLVTCPTCGDAMIDKAVMAPAVGTKGNRRESREIAPVQPRDVATMVPEDAAKLQAVIEKLAQVQARLLENSSWVGSAFAEKARAMHYGEETPASIHGVTDADEARALIEEGIAVAPLPIPVVPPGEQN
jgi:hypothetical protein